jgi:small-conductance mechanosensitive channel
MLENHVLMMHLVLFGQIQPGPPPLASWVVRLPISIVVIGVAVVGGRWLAALASKVPSSYLQRHPGNRANKTASSGETADRVLGTITLVSVGLIAAVVLLLIWLSDPNSVFKEISPVSLGEFLATLALRAIGSLLVFVCMLGFGRLFQRLVEGRLIHARISPNLALLAGRVVYIASLVVGVMVILPFWGTGIVVPVAVVGALTVALTLALQDVLRNLVSGIYLLLEHPFVIGDRIMLAPYSGRIEDIQIRFTALRTDDNLRVLIPNSMLFTGAVVNLSAYDASRVALLITLPDKGGAWIDGIEEQVRAALLTVPGICPEPSPQIIFNGTAAGKVQLQVVFWLPTNELDAAASLCSQAIVRLRETLDEAEAEVEISRSSSPLSSSS